MCLFGWNDSAMFFVLPFLFYVITRLMIACWGESYLPVLSVLYAVIEMTSVFESTGEAMRPILPIYIGDKNVPAVLGLTKHSRTVNLILALPSAACWQSGRRGSRLRLTSRIPRLRRSATAECGSSR
jgi:hypothetical protein